MKQPEADPAKKTGLFGASVAFGSDANKKVGLFGAPAGDAKKDSGEADKPKTGLFGAPVSGGLFSNAGPAPSGSLFGKPPAGGLFGASATSSSGSIFANAGSTLFGKPQEKKADAEKSDGDDGVESDKDAPIYAADTSKVEFKGGAQPVQQSPFQKIFEVSFRAADRQASWP